MIQVLFAALALLWASSAAADIAPPRRVALGSQPTPKQALLDRTDEWTQTHSFTACDDEEELKSGALRSETLITVGIDGGVRVCPLDN